ncbi:MAG: hypothetical protein F4X40_02705 [Chloroflexi bacterium]|nr:hypothetical protein [Chloroflexota bacterium]
MDFMPLWFGYLAVVGFYFLWCGLTPPLPVTEVSWASDDRTYQLNAVFAQYSVTTAFFVVVLVELAVLAFVIRSVWTRRKFGAASELRQVFGTVWVGMFLLSAGTFCIFRSVCTDIGLHGTWERHVLGVPVRDSDGWPSFLTSEQVAFWESLLAAATISAVLAAVCTASPRRIPAEERSSDNASDEDVAMERSSAAQAEIANKLNWLRYYLAAATIYLITGVIYTKVAISSLLRVSDREMDTQLTLARDQAADAIVGYQASLYVALLLIVFMPVALRLLRAGKRIAEVELGPSAQQERRRWLARRGLSWSVGQNILNIAAVASPGIVAVLSAVLEFR